MRSRTMSSRSARVLVLAAFAALSLSTERAFAQQDTARTARAEKLFVDAKRLLDAGQIAEACAAFAESRKLDPQIGTLLNLALCHEREGKNASAWAEYSGVVEAATRTGQSKRAEFAKGRALAIEPRLSRVTFVLDRAKMHDARILIDGEPVEASYLDGTPVPLNPGAHRAIVEATGKQSAVVAFVVPQGPSMSTVTIPDLAPAPAGAAPLDAHADDRASESARPAPWAWAIGGIGAAAVVTGGVFGALALAKKSDADADCPTERCLTTAGYDASRDASTYATVSTVLVASGLALVLGGAALVVWGPRARSAATARGLVVRF